VAATVTDEQLAATLARIEAKLDRAIDDHADHEQRIRKLEQVIWRATGAAAVVSATGAALLTKLIGG
jgi:hypothetical protein